MDIKEVATRTDLEKFLKYCENAGFRFHANTWEVEQSKLESIIWAANTLNIGYDYKKLKREFFDPTQNFNEFKNLVEAYFSFFDETYAVQETVNKYCWIDSIHLNGDEAKRLLPDYLAKGFKPIHDEPLPYTFSVYDFSKDPTKTKYRFRDLGSSNINLVLKKLGASWECPSFSSFSGKNPDNENIKVFKNGNCLIYDQKIATKLHTFLKNKYLDKTPGNKSFGLIKM